VGQPHLPKPRSSGTTASRIVELLRQGPKTIDDLVVDLDLTRTAVRAQITVLMTRGMVEPAGVRKGSSKPARLFGVTREAVEGLSRAYIPVLIQLLKQLVHQMPPKQFSDLVLEVGRGLGAEHHLRGTLRERVNRANQILHSLGGLTTVAEEGDRFVITGQGCPLSAATTAIPEACGIVTGLLEEVIGQPVESCCGRYDHKRCCFEISQGAA
jgi:predicted ArsR family transcriptional regulator